MSAPAGVIWRKGLRSMANGACVEVAKLPIDSTEITEAERDMLAVATAVGVTR
ncbi:DUF397 domain-containing protein [Actinoallomurus purpureus]|uniref:DUF397 domain-containing protein n=1 Tax=Actinoallomurus purpureus TaxID=478114 RepID=UPI002092ED79|nr:DUF397 domain-containing protein [Actinoallomurus purpureus]MCO6011735.1 DUF397 domain-containing protein [Actinoallomurus purpureus]